MTGQPIKFGCCVSLLASRDDPAGLNNLQSVADVGFDYVELPLAELMQLSDKEFDRLLLQLEGLCLPCESCNNLFPETIRLTGLERDETIITSYLDTAMKRVMALGAEIIVFGSAKSKNVPVGFPVAEALEQIAQTMHLIQASLPSEHLSVAVEPVCKLESNILNTYKQVHLLVQKQKLQQIHCLVDYYHFSIEQEPLNHLFDGGQSLRHVHIANPKGRVYPRRGDGVNYQPFFQMLRDIKYKSRVSIEAFANNFDVEATYALELLRELA